MSGLNNAAIAAALSLIAEQFEVIAGSFRSGGSDSSGAGVNGGAGGKKRGAPAKKVVAADDVDYDELRDQTRAKLQELLEAKGKEVMVSALESVGAGKLADVDDTQLQELHDKAQELIDAEEEEAPAPAKKPRGKKAAAPAVTLEQLQEAARALIEADKAAYVKLTKKHGKPSEMDESGYAAALAAYQEAMPPEEEAGDDDLL